MARGGSGEQGSEDPGRWERLVDGLLHLADTPDLDETMARVAALAVESTAATWSALGMLGSDGGLVTVVRHGDAGPCPGLGPRDAGPLLERTAAAPAWAPVAPDVCPGAVALPLRRREPLGALVVGGIEGDVDPTDRKALQLLVTAAAQALEGARLRSWVAWRERWLEASNEITSTMTGWPSDTAALQLVADRAREIGGARVAWIISGPDVDHLAFRVSSGSEVDPEYLAQMPLEDSWAREVIVSGRPLRLEHLNAEPRMLPHRDVPGWTEVGPAIIVPLPGVGGHQGVLGLGWAPEDRGRYHRLDTDLPAAFAQQAALALQVGRAHADQQQLAVLRDRDRIGRDLHDVVIQRLFAVGLGLASLDRVDGPERTARLDDAVDQIDEAIADIRRTIHDLGRGSDDEDVQSLVSDIVERATPALGFRPVLRLGGPLRTLTPAPVVPEVLAVLTESVGNVVRHAHATSLRVELSLADGTVVLRVTDDGVGIAEGVHESGLANMRRRAEKLGGTCEVATRPGAGTRVEWRVPATPA